MGKCPTCGTLVSTLKGHEASISLGAKYIKGIIYLCPNTLCNAVLGCQADPLSLAGDLVNDLTAAVQKALRPNP